MSNKIILVVVAIVIISVSGYGVYYSKTIFEKITNEQQAFKNETTSDINKLEGEIKSQQEIIKNKNLDVKIVSGLVDKDGNIKRGTGFTVVKDKTLCGYKITFDPSFNTNPIVVASIDDAEKPSGFIRVINFSLTNAVGITTMNNYDPQTGSGTCGDRGFSFVAVASLF